MYRVFTGIKFVFTLYSVQVSGNRLLSFNGVEIGVLMLSKYWTVILPISNPSSAATIQPDILAIAFPESI